MPTTADRREHREPGAAIETHCFQLRQLDGVVPVSPYFRWKAIVDRLLAAILLVPALPLIGLLWLLVRCMSPGPGIYRQQRVGQFGRPFTMYKLRTMRTDAEMQTGPIWSNGRDPRVTPLGRVLRYTHLDELPQLLNVLKGEMSLVGPRPERPEFVTHLSVQIEDYAHRLAVPPGITGLAQLNLPPDTDLTSVSRKLVLDLEYVETASLWLEVRVLICTAARVVKVPTARVFGLHRVVQLPVESVPKQPMPVPTSAALVDTRRGGWESGHGCHPGALERPSSQCNHRP